MNKPQNLNVLENISTYDQNVSTQVIGHPGNESEYKNMVWLLVLIKCFHPGFLIGIEAHRLLGRGPWIVGLGHSKQSRSRPNPGFHFCWAVDNGLRNLSIPSSHEADQTPPPISDKKVTRHCDVNAVYIDEIRPTRWDRFTYKVSRFVESKVRVYQVPSGSRLPLWLPN